MIRQDKRRCPHCDRQVVISNGKYTTHGPARGGGPVCEGSRKPVRRE